jgi:hypothetical protein
MPGGTASQQFSFGIKPQSNPIFASNVTLTPIPSGNCLRLTQFASGCTQTGIRPEANLPLSCDVRIESLGPNPNGGPDIVLETQVFSYVPRYQVSSLTSPIRIFAAMNLRTIILKPAKRFRVSARSSNVEAIAGINAGINALIFQLGSSPQLGNLLAALAEIINQINGQAANRVVDALIDNISYDAAAEC